MSGSSKSFSAPIGTRDILPPESARFADLTATFASWAHRYGFSLVVSPLFEDVGVFNRGIGADSDIARKEMYVFEDRGGRQLALRPEGTASIVRAFVQHHPTTPWKVWYVTPAFRYERPQAGRYRQHHQVGVEALGTADPVLDVEVIALAWRFYVAIGLARVELQINSMGDATCQPSFRAALEEYLAVNEDMLCDEHRPEWRKNPLRVLDCKRDACISATANAPKFLDHLCEPCRTHFGVVTSGLEAAGIAFSINHRLVRGFDYYTRTVFEFASLALPGAQNAVGGGGRYDGLAEDLGGEPTCGIGFGSGVERLLLAQDAEDLVAVSSNAVDVFVVDTTGSLEGLRVLERLRVAGVAADRGYDGRSMKAQMKVADRSGARLALLLGPQELASATITMRDLRQTSEDNRQRSIPLADVEREVMNYFAEDT